MSQAIGFPNKLHKIAELESIWYYCRNLLICAIQVTMGNDGAYVNVYLFQWRTVFFSLVSSIGVCRGCWWFLLVWHSQSTQFVDDNKSIYMFNTKAVWRMYFFLLIYRRLSTGFFFLLLHLAYNTVCIHNLTNWIFDINICGRTVFGHSINYARLHEFESPFRYLNLYIYRLIHFSHVEWYRRIHKLDIKSFISDTANHLNDFDIEFGCVLDFEIWISIWNGFYRHWSSNRKSRVDFGYESGFWHKIGTTNGFRHRISEKNLFWEKFNEIQAN